jgi:hypothetical protein
MPSVRQIQQKLKEFDAAARHTENPDGFKAAWKRIFNQNLSDAGAKSFARYYKEMRSKTSRKARRTMRRRQSAGAYTPLPQAPVNYGTTPGVLASTMGRFPVEVDTDAASIKDLDVYFHDSLPLSKAGYWPTVPADMGSNKVGGGRRRKGSRKTHKGRKTRKGGRKQRGGNLMESLNMRGYVASPYPNMIQSAVNAWQGGVPPIPSPSSPVSHTWQPQSQGVNLINPGLVTHISSDFSKLASPAPWQTSN